MSLLGTGVGIDPPRLRFSRGEVTEKGLSLTLSWGPRAPSWGEAGGRPFSRLSTPPLVPSKLKVAAERCPSGAEVGTCVTLGTSVGIAPPRFSVFEGGR